MSGHGELEPRVSLMGLLHTIQRSGSYRLPGLPEAGVHFASVTEFIDILLYELDVGSPGLNRSGSAEGENDLLV